LQVASNGLLATRPGPGG